MAHKAFAFLGETPIIWTKTDKLWEKLTKQPKIFNEQNFYTFVINDLKDNVKKKQRWNAYMATFEYDFSD